MLRQFVSRDRNISRIRSTPAHSESAVKTSAALTAAFRPVVTSSLDKVGATKYWADIFNTYNRLPTTFHKVNPDLTAYVTERALNGLFVSIAEEETKIRANPAARTTDLLQKVFGAH